MSDVQIVRCKSQRYAVALEKPLPRTRIMEREGIIISLETADGRIAHGEAAPLPGWSMESLRDVEETLTEIRQALMAGEKELRWRKLPRSLQFAFDSAIADLSRWEAYPLHHPKLPVSALLVGSVDECVTQARRATAAGCRTLKVKVGGAVREDVGKVRAILAGLENGVRNCQLSSGDVLVRLDANRAWDLSEALEFATQMEGAPIDYLEEPVRDLNELAAFSNASNIPLALDESLIGLRPGSLSDGLNLKAVVLKPTLLGGLGVCDAWASWAMEQKISVVGSSCFESLVGVGAIARWMAGLNQDPIALGVDTLSWWPKGSCERNWMEADYRVNCADRPSYFN